MLVIAYLASTGQNTDAFICSTHELRALLDRPCGDRVGVWEVVGRSTDRISMLTGKCYS